MYHSPLKPLWRTNSEFAKAVILQPESTNPSVSYLWSDGSTGPTLEVFLADTYWVDIYNGACTERLSVEVTEGCYPSVLVPNAFTPNGDGVNDTFEVIGRNLTMLEIYIFDQWGKLLFYSDDPGRQWNGQFNQELLPIGSYAYQIHYKGDVDGKIVSFSKAGTVQLIN